MDDANGSDKQSVVPGDTMVLQMSNPIKPRILLVNDREVNLLAIEAILKPGGYLFEKASSDHQALTMLLAEFEFAMIVIEIDSDMPNRNGFDPTSLIYESEKLSHIPIIFITSNQNGNEKMFRGDRSGAVDYIFKPINPDILCAKVSMLLDLYRKNMLLQDQEQQLLIVTRDLEREIKERNTSEKTAKQFNRQLLENIASLESANKDLDRFTFMASHDLQEPLRKIRMFSDMLMAKYKPVLGDDARMIVRIGKSAERMQILIADILSFSKLASDKSSLVKSDINPMLRELLIDLEEEIEEAQAEIVIEPVPLLMSSPRLMRALFENLISNSLKYRRRDVRPCIRIRSEITMDAGINNRNEEEVVSKRCRILIEDNGIGFDQKFAEEIFGMLRRLHNHAEFEGTGVGLALCKRIVELHHGNISAKSKINEGSTFIISLPLPE